MAIKPVVSTRCISEEGADIGKADVFELTGKTPVAFLKGVAIARDALVGRLPPPEV